MSPRGRALLPVALALAVSLPSLLPGFIHDDHRLVEQNALVQEAARLPQILTRGYWTVDEHAVPNLYRPVTILSLALNRLALGPGALGFRVVDLALHLLVVALLFAVARRMLPAPRPEGAIDAALLAAGLFAVHPIHTEVLGLVVGRSELLAAAFALGAVVLFLDACDAEARVAGRAGLRRVAALACLGLALLSKESAIAAPLLVLAAGRLRPDATPATRRGEVRFHAAALAVVAGCLGLRTWVLGGLLPQAFTHFVDNPIAHLPFPRSLFTALAALARYAVLLVWPWRLSIDYSYASIPEAASLLDPRALAGAALFAAVGAVLPWAWRRRPPLAFALLLLALPLLPVANLVAPIGTILAERLLYLPSAGFCILVGLGVAPWSRRTAVRLALAVVAIALAGQSVRRFADWRDDRTIFAAAVRLYPDNVRAQFNYGAASERAGDEAAAETAYRRAIAVWPRFADARYNLGGLLGRARRWEEAVGEYHAALAEQPGNVTYLVNAGHALTQAGQPRQAVELLRRAVDLDRGSDRGWTDLGAAYLLLGSGAEALAAWEEAARLDPGNAEYVANRALGREATGDFAGAAKDWGGAAARKPDDAILRYREGKALERDRRPDDAAAAYRASIRLAPASPVPHKALGLLLLASGDRDGARQALQRAADLDPRGSVMDAEARRILADLAGPRGTRGSSPAPPSPEGAPRRR